ncbi:MAG: ATP-binding protein [Lachnospiraceae bacterium]|nr:ATP-binding protein [Lachnospiraceae bacterium]
MDNKKLPISIQSFEKIIKNNCIYVDKTDYIFNLVHDVSQFFLSRPRRFGKSLLLSTLRAYWEGRKELFTGLKIEKLEENNPDAWQQYPVFYFDFNGKNYKTQNALEEMLASHLCGWEEEYEIDGNYKSIEERFQNLLIKASKKAKKGCVVLVDEYDKPLLDVIDDKDMQEHNKAVFRGFFSNLKKCDDYLQFVFIAGVTKFHKVSIFSDLNQLNDISLNKDYAGICGITEQELEKFFEKEISILASEQDLSMDECKRKLKVTYDGYRFHPMAEGVYNPYSLLMTFYMREFKKYWFETGTPTFLVDAIRSNNFDVRRFSNKTIYATDSALQDYSGDTLSLTSLLYQSGYLTIADYNKRLSRYTLCFPNEEVKYGLLNSMMPSYVHGATEANGLDIFTLEDYAENGNLEGIRNLLTALFARITYTTKEVVFEHYFQSIIYIVFTLLGEYALCEMHTFNGRIDCKVETGNFIYLFEFKRDDSAESALKQIEDNDYELPFVADSRKVYKIGVSFDSKKRILAEWKVAE